MDRGWYHTVGCFETLGGARWRSEALGGNPPGKSSKIERLFKTMSGWLKGPRDWEPLAPRKKSSDNLPELMLPRTAAGSNPAGRIQRSGKEHN